MAGWIRIFWVSRANPMSSTGKQARRAGTKASSTFCPGSKHCSYQWIKSSLVRGIAMFGLHLNLRLWIFVVFVIWAIIQGLFHLGSRSLRLRSTTACVRGECLIDTAAHRSGCCCADDALQFFQGLRKRRPKLHLRLCIFCCCIGVL